MLLCCCIREIVFRTVTSLEVGSWELLITAVAGVEITASPPPLHYEWLDEYAPCLALCPTSRPSIPAKSTIHQRAALALPPPAPLTLASGRPTFSISSISKTSAFTPAPVLARCSTPTATATRPRPPTLRTRTRRRLVHTHSAASGGTTHMDSVRSDGTGVGIGKRRSG